MRKPQGYAQIVGPDSTAECDTFTCAHCQHVVHVPVRANPDDLGGWCRMCMKAICPRCVATGVCDPFEKKLEREEARYHSLRSMGLR